ncbi:hypothetical protein JQ615_28690 [Bradyrhizobium jicamae]|uniref:Uncharacterized protein n=1 Tax=Bradyrhizobium jicamae TaxID=280332 RepID=A0ABS5FRD6_9BRAD|nr:hypothetical protein [Bradyrhizobium jicamae]MBR0799371.1 hypothetical protein [Bradyrhizobium jicamae]
MHLIPETAVIALDAEGARPGTTIDMNRKSAFLHMTVNADAVVSGVSDDMTASGIRMSGSVDARMSRGENTSNWKFRFIQLVVNLQSYFAYAGISSADGYMEIRLDIPPAIPREKQYDFLLDADPKFYGADVMPFTNNRDHFVFPKMSGSGSEVAGISTIVANMYDAPSSRFNLAFQNKRTHKVNLLRMVSVYKLFLTAFVMRDERSMKIEPLAFVPWILRWEMRYGWQQDQCTATSVGGKFDFGTSSRSIAPAAQFLGMKADYLLEKIKNPTMNPDDTANEVDRKAHRHLDQDNTPNVQYWDEWANSTQF